jgi:hypothetical protein
MCDKMRRLEGRNTHAVARDPSNSGCRGTRRIAHQHVDDKERQEPAHVAQAHCIANPAAVVIKASHAPGALHNGLGAALVLMGLWCIHDG